MAVPLMRWLARSPRRAIEDREHRRLMRMTIDDFRAFRTARICVHVSAFSI
jgi:hypothetical protein